MRAGLAGSFAILAALLHTQAVALECNEYSIRSDFWFHKEQPETYHLVLGSFSNLRKIEEREMISNDEGFSGGFEIWKAEFQGFKASRKAFDQPFETEVTLTFPDYSFLGGGSDSARMVDRLVGQTGLTWLEKASEGYELTAKDCWPMIDTDPQSVKSALRCLNGGYCPKF